jgi:hypothetical protein
MKPAKGSRLHYLVADPSIKESHPMAICGCVTLKISRKEHKEKSRTKANVEEHEYEMGDEDKGYKTQRWRIEVLKIANLAAVSEEAKSNPYCELFWKVKGEGCCWKCAL